MSSSSSKERKQTRLAGLIGKGKQRRGQRETLNGTFHGDAARTNPWLGGDQDSQDMIDLFVEVLAASVGCQRDDPPQHWRLRQEHPLANEPGMKNYTWTLKQAERMAVARLLRVLPILCKDLRAAAAANPKRTFLLAYFAHVSPRTAPDESQDNYLKILPRDVVARAHHSLHDGIPRSAAHEILPCYTKSGYEVAPPDGEFGTWRDEGSATAVHTDPRESAFCDMPQTAFPRLAPTYTPTMTNHRKQQLADRLTQLEALSTPPPKRIAKLKAELRLGPVDTRLLRQLPGMDEVFMPSFTARPVHSNDTDEDFAVIRGPAHADPTVAPEQILMDRYHTVNQLEYNTDAEATAYYARFEATKDVPQSLPPEVKRFVGRLRYVYYRALLQNFWTARTGVGQALVEMGLTSAPDPPAGALHGRWSLRDITDYALPPRIDFTGHSVAGPPGLVPRAVFASQSRDQHATARGFMSRWQDAMNANALVAWDAATGLPENHDSRWLPPRWLRREPSALDGRIGLGFDPDQADRSALSSLSTYDCACTHCSRAALQQKGARIESTSHSKSFVSIVGQPERQTPNLARGVANAASTMAATFCCPVAKLGTAHSADNPYTKYIQLAGLDGCDALLNTATYCSMACRVAVETALAQYQLRALTLDWPALEKKLPWKKTPLHESRPFSSSWPTAAMLYEAQLQLHAAIGDAVCANAGTGQLTPFSSDAPQGSAAQAGTLYNLRLAEIRMLNIHLGLLAAASAFEAFLCARQRLPLDPLERGASALRCDLTVPGITMSVQQYCLDRCAPHFTAPLRNVARIYDSYVYGSTPETQQGIQLVTSVTRRPRPQWIETVKTAARDGKIFTS